MPAGAIRHFGEVMKNVREPCIHGYLTAQQHQALLAVKGFGHRRPVNAGDLAERLGIHHHSVVGLIDRLEAKALIRRRPNSDDRRQVLLELTPKVERLLTKLSAAHREELRGLGPLLQGLLRHFEKDSTR